METSNDSLVEKGFRDGILLEKPNARFYTFGSNFNIKVLKMQLDAALKYNPDLFFAKGLQAVKLISTNLKSSYPLVFVMTEDPVKNKIIASRKLPERQITGITTKIPVLHQLKVIKKFMNFNKVAIITNNKYHYSQTISHIKNLEDFLFYRSFNIVYDNLENFYNKIISKKPDLIYILNDTKIDSEAIQLINRLKIPTVSENSKLVEKGVLLSLIIDDYKAGRLAAKQAINILNSKKADKIPVLEIEHFMVNINIKTAKTIKAQIPMSLLVIADKIIR
jgi:putative ABC transport system substrate-binding protein